MRDSPKRFHVYLGGPFSGFMRRVESRSQEEERHALAMTQDSVDISFLGRAHTTEHSTKYALYHRSHAGWKVPREEEEERDRDEYIPYVYQRIEKA